MTVPRVELDELDIGPDQICRWNGEPFTGMGIETDAKGRLISEEEYRDGSQTGVAREWYPSGQLKSEEHYEYGGREGVSRTYHPNGQLKSEAQYESTIRVSEKKWDDAGNLVDDYTISESSPAYRILLIHRKRKEGAE